MHTPCIFNLLFNLYRLNMWTFILIFDFIHLIFKKFIVISLFVINYTSNKKKSFKYNTLNRWIKGTCLISFLSDDISNTEKDKCSSAGTKMSNSKEIERFEDECSIKFSKEESKSHQSWIDDPNDLKRQYRR